jgi:hypothetical protein
MWTLPISHAVWWIPRPRVRGYRESACVGSILHARTQTIVTLLHETGQSDWIAFSVDAKPDRTPDVLHDLRAVGLHVRRILSPDTRPVPPNHGAGLLTASSRFDLVWVPSWEKPCLRRRTLQEIRVSWLLIPAYGFGATRLSGDVRGVVKTRFALILWVLRGLGRSHTLVADMRFDSLPARENAANANNGVFTSTSGMG